MKAIIISLLLFLTVNAQNIWHVNRDATGANTGRSWTDAWTAFDSSSWAGTSDGINWNILSPGDTVYVSGGTDSTRYTNAIIQGENGSRHTFASGDPVVIAAAWQTGHNGDVYFAPSGGGSGIFGRIYNKSNIKLVGFNYVETRGENGGLFQIGNGDCVTGGCDPNGDNDSLVTMENCTFTGNGTGTIIYSSGSKITYKNCVIEQTYNTNLGDQDPMGFSAGRGGYTIDGCKVIYRIDGSPTGAHRDGLQFSNFGIEAYDEVQRITIKNSLIIHPLSSPSWTGLIYSSNPRVNTDWYIYNNIIVSANVESGVGGVILNQPVSTWTQSIYLFNNTIIMNDDGSGLSTSIVFSGYVDTVIAKNNLVVCDAPVTTYINNQANIEPTTYHRDFDYNAYYEYDGISDPFAAGDGFGAYSYAQWQSAGEDANSITGNSTAVTFTNKYGTDLEDYFTTTGRDAGINLWDEYPFLRTDILGNERPQNGDWDIGALEFNGSQSNNVNVNGKIFLQGPFSTNLMSTTLTQSSLLPNSQPYNTPPWNYNGNESFTSGPSSTMVDWVLVELRSASNPSQVVARRAAVLKNNGLLLRPNGSEGVIFNNVDPGSYYIAIYHRNHLAIMSAAPVPLSSNSALYDFTTGMNKAYGQNPMVELVAGKYGMYATDGNADGIINTTDRDDVWLIQNGNMGYLEGDFNMNSGVTVHDVNQLWNINNGAVTQVP